MLDATGGSLPTEANASGATTQNLDDITKIATVESAIRAMRLLTGTGVPRAPKAKRQGIAKALATFIGVRTISTGGRNSPEGKAMVSLIKCFDGWECAEINVVDADAAIAIWTDDNRETYRLAVPRDAFGTAFIGIGERMAKAMDIPPVKGLTARHALCFHEVRAGRSISVKDAKGTEGAATFSAYRVSGKLNAKGEAKPDRNVWPFYHQTHESLMVNLLVDAESLNRCRKTLGKVEGAAASGMSAEEIRLSGLPTMGTAATEFALHGSAFNRKIELIEQVLTGGKVADSAVKFATGSHGLARKIRSTTASQQRHAQAHVVALEGRKTFHRTSKHRATSSATMKVHVNDDAEVASK